MQSGFKRSPLILCLLVFFSFSVGASPTQSPQPTIRVAVLEGAVQFELSVRGKYEIIDVHSGEVVFSGAYLQKAPVSLQEDAIHIGHLKYTADRLRVIARKDAAIFTDGWRLRGDIEILRTKNKNFIVINRVGLEDYVKGVLYKEISNRWPLAAIKAQAVATRTYALFRMAKSKGAEYDVTSDIYSQVYGGRNAEKYRTTVAANRTEGEVLAYKGEILPAYFHATCGGFTEDADQLWKQDLPPLKGVFCPWCRTSPHYFWRKNFRSKDIQAQLNQHGYELGLIQKIQLVDRNLSGRIRNLKIIARDGKETLMAGKDFREIIGPNLIRSNNYTVEMKGYYFDLVGKGWGHGVGMCQWGASEMARLGKNYKQILSYYYPGADLVNFSEVKF